jgi:hypothetical protein
VTWTETNDERNAHTEWVRDDGWATIRLRTRHDGWIVRLDRLTQAPEGSLYLDERAETRDEAERVAAEWRETYDVAER